MKLDKKQLPQLIAFGVLLLACIGFVAFQLKPAAAPQAAPQAKSAPAKTAEAAAPDQAEAEDPGVASLPTLPKRDPFEPMMVASLPNQVQIRIPTRSPETGPVETRIATGPIPRMPIPRMPMPVQIGGITALTAGNDGAPGDAAVRPADPAFVLTGIIRGDRNVAIIRLSDERHIVQAGQWINNDYRVISVTADGVVLAARDHRISLKLGGDKNASS